MVNDLLQIFKNAKNIEKAVFDNYIPDDGNYFRLDNDNNMKRLTLKRNQTEQNELYQWFKEADYNSCIISTDKSVDSKKKIHSNNIYTLFIKCDILPKIGSNKEKMLTEEELEEAINRYFDTFLQKEKDKNTRRILEIMDFQQIKQEELQSCKERIKEAIQKVINEIEQNNLADKNYVKIFIEQDMKDYQREGNRYFYQKIFNKNKYNVEINGEIWGLANNNMRIE